MSSNISVLRTLYLLSGFFGYLVFILCGCQPKPDINTMAHPVHVDAFMGKRLESEIRSARKEKDEYFKTGTDSPLPLPLRFLFKGLEYYPINWKYRFEGPVNRYPNPSQLEIITTTGERRNAIRYGFIRFVLDGKQFKLQVYRLLESDAKNLFIPFVDKNAGKETYPAGRYIDLIEKPNGLYVIDFNAAYNPYCAYGENYDCPITPSENRLTIPIPVGEKILSIAPKRKVPLVPAA